MLILQFSIFFFFNDTATTEIYTLSLHDALPIYPVAVNPDRALRRIAAERSWPVLEFGRRADRKSTRLNSSHSQISYAVFCLKKKKKQSVRKSNSPNAYSHDQQHATEATLTLHTR